MSKKIAFIATGYIKSYDGVSVYTENLLKELLNRSFIKDGHCMVDIYIGESVRSLLIDRVDISNSARMTINFIPVSDSNFFLKIFGLYKKLAFKKEYDLIFTTNFMPFILPFSKVIKVIHDFSPEITPSLYSKFFKIYHSFLLKSGKKFDYAIGYISETTKKDLKRFYDVDQSNKRLVYLPNGIPFKVKNFQRPKMEIVEKKYNNNKLDFLVVGRINRAKGFDRILKFCSYFDEFLKNFNNFKRVTLHIAGKQTDETKHIFEDLKLSNIEIIFHGFVDDDSLNKLYSKSHFSFFLSRNEGYGLPLVEALWFRSIPILSNIDIFNEILGLDYPKFDDISGYEDKIKDFILQIYFDKDYLLSIYQNLENVLEWEKDGYKRSSQNLIEFIKSI